MRSNLYYTIRGLQISQLNNDSDDIDGNDARTVLRLGLLGWIGLLYYVRAKSVECDAVSVWCRNLVEW